MISAYTFSISYFEVDYLEVFQSIKICILYLHFGVLGCLEYKAPSPPYVNFIRAVGINPCNNACCHPGVYTLRRFRTTQNIMTL